VLGAKLETVGQLHEHGLSLRAIAAKVHASAMTVQRIIRRDKPRESCLRLLFHGLAARSLRLAIYM
jgi:IS30 family transposase